jgi:type II secretory pathway pseudopilin PulG
MSKLFIIVAMTVTTAVSVPAFAGRDAAQISQQEKSNQTVAAQRAQETARLGKAATKIVLPLDHGPRAETTPWLNQQRRLLAEAMTKSATAGGPAPK